MIYVNVMLAVRSEADIDEVRGLLVEQARLSRQEAGCVRFEIYHSQNVRRVFLLHEHWETQASLDAHRQGLAYTTIYQPKVLPKVDRTPHPSDLVA